MSLAEFSNPEAWYDRAPNGQPGWILTDPLTGNALDTHKPPTFITDEPALAAGLDYLPHGKVTIAFGSHGRAAHLGDPKIGWFEQQVQAHDYYGYEGIGHGVKDDEAAKSLIQYIRDNKIKNIKELLGGDSPVSFVYRKLAALAMAPDTHHFCYDVARDRTPTESAIFECEVSIGQIGIYGAVIATIGINNAREWTMAANVGSELLRQEKNQQPRTPSVFMTLGGVHRDVARKMRVVQAVVHEKLVLPNPEFNDVIKHVTSAMNGKVIQESDMPILRFLHKV